MSKLIMIAILRVILLAACGDNVRAPPTDACPASLDAPACALIRRHLPGLERALPPGETARYEIALAASSSPAVVVAALAGSFPCLTMTLATSDLVRCRVDALAEASAACSMLLPAGGTSVQITVASCGPSPSIVTRAEVLAAPL